MKNPLLILLFSFHFYAQEIDLKTLPQYDCSHKNWNAFSRDRVIIVKPTHTSYSTESFTEDFHHFLKGKYVEKQETELNKNDLKKSLLIIGKASDFKAWKKYDLPVKKRKKGFVFNGIKFNKEHDAMWFNSPHRIVITANSSSSLETILDSGQLGMDFFTLQENQLTHYGNFRSDKLSEINSYNVQDLKNTNYTLYNKEHVDFYISKKLKNNINLEKTNNNLTTYVKRYADFFDLTIPQEKINVLIHLDLEEMTTMMGRWNLSCGGNSAGMNLRGEIHCVGASQGLINHEISHHVFNSNIPAEKLPILLLEGVVEIFTNYEDPELYKKRLENVHANWTKYNFEQFFKNSNYFYNENSSLNYQVSGIWVKYFIDTYGLENFKTLCDSDDKINFITLLTQNSFEYFTQAFKSWLNNQVSVHSH